MVWEVDEEEGEKIRFATEVTACIKAREREREVEREVVTRETVGGKWVGMSSFILPPLVPVQSCHHVCRATLVCTAV